MIYYDRFDPVSSRIAPSHFIYLIIVCNFWKERGGNSPVDEVTPSYISLVIDAFYIGHFLVYIFVRLVISLLSLYL